MKKLISILILILLLSSFSWDYTKSSNSVYAVGEGCSDSHEYNNETSIRFEKSMAEGITYHHWVIEYKNEYGLDRIRRSQDPSYGIDYLTFEIVTETKFDIKFYDVNNQIVAEREVTVEPLNVSIQLYKAGDSKLFGKTTPNTEIKIGISNVSDDEFKPIGLSSDNEGKFEFDYDERDTVLRLQKKDENMLREQVVLIKKEDFNDDSPLITKVSGYDSDTGIYVESKDLLKGLNLEFYDKDKKLVETNSIKGAGTSYSIHGSKKNSDRTFYKDGIRYVRVQAFNTNNCKSTWTEMIELIDSTPPEFSLNPWMEGDVYVTGVGDPGTRIEWKQNPFSKNEVKGTTFVPNNGKIKVKFPLDIKINPPLLEFYDESGNNSNEWVQPVSKIDRFALTEDREDFIFALSDTSSSNNYGKNYSIEFNGKLWSGSIGNNGMMELGGGDIHFIVPKLPYELKFTLYNIDGSVKYSVRQMMTKREKPSQLKNISYDLDKQELYADSNLCYTASLWNKKTNWQWFAYAKNKRVKLFLSDMKKIVRVGDKIYINTFIPGAPSSLQEITIKQNKKLKSPLVKDTTTKSKYVEGTTYPNSKVLVKSGKKNYQGQSDSKGKFKIKIPSLSAESEVAISAVDRLNQSTPIVKKKVLRVFTKFTISKVKSGGNILKGTGYIGSEVKAYKSSKVIAKGTVDKKGNYSLKVTKLKKNYTLLLEMSKSGFQTMAKTIRVN